MVLSSLPFALMMRFMLLMFPIAFISLSFLFFFQLLQVNKVLIAFFPNCCDERSSSFC